MCSDTMQSPYSTITVMTTENTQYRGMDNVQPVRQMTQQETEIKGTSDDHEGGQRSSRASPSIEDPH